MILRIDIQHLIKRVAAGSYRSKLTRVCAELPASCADIFLFLLIVRIGYGGVAHLVCFLKLVEDVTFSYFVGVKFEAERSQTDLA